MGTALRAAAAKGRCCAAGGFCLREGGEAAAPPGAPSLRRFPAALPCGPSLRPFPSLRLLPASLPCGAFLRPFFPAALPCASRAAGPRWARGTALPSPRLG